MLKSLASVMKIGLKFKLTILLSLLVLIGLVFLVFVIIDNNNKSVIAWVDGNPIMLEEFTNAISSGSNDAQSYFVEKFGAKNTVGDFWTTSFNGVTPSDYLKDKTIKNLESIKMQQILAKSIGLVSQIDYDKFIDEYKKQNENIPPSLSKSSAFGMAKDDMVRKIIAKISDKELAVSTDEIQMEYNLLKSTTYAKYSKNLQIVSVSIMDEHFVKVNDKETKGNEILGKIKARMEKGVKFEDIKKDYANTTDLKISFIEKTYDDNVVRRFVSYYPKFIKAIQVLNSGEVSSIINDQDGSLKVMRCTSVTNQGSQPLEKVSKAIKTALANKKFEALIAKMLNDAKIEINKGVYDAYKIK
jgi:hypothetical protein